MLETYKIRTDLAVEARERFTEENVEVRGVEVKEVYNEEKELRTTVVKITTEWCKNYGASTGNLYYHRIRGAFCAG